MISWTVDGVAEAVEAWPDVTLLVEVTTVTLAAIDNVGHVSTDGVG